MIKSILLITLLISSQAMAIKNERTDISSSDAKIVEIPADKLRYMIEIVGEILVFNKSGSRLIYQAPEKRSWRFGSEKAVSGNWSYENKSFPRIALHHEWDVNAQGELTAHLIQYDSMEESKEGSHGEIKTGKIIKDETFVVTNFDPINLIVEQNDERRIVVKFSPRLSSGSEAEDIGAVSIGGRDMTVFDNTGKLWAADLTSEGDNIYFGITSNFGTVYLSYLPFKGAQKIGKANAKGIVIKDKALKLQFRSRDAFLPYGVEANVYGLFDLSTRTDKTSSVSAFGSDKEENFIKHIAKK